MSRTTSFRDNYWGNSMVSGIVLAIKNPIPYIYDLPDVPKDWNERYKIGNFFEICENTVKTSDEALRQLAKSPTRKPNPTTSYSQNTNSSHAAQLPRPFDSFAILQPKPCDVPSSENETEIKESKLLKKTHGNLLRDFDNTHNDDPFDTVEMQTINDMEELETVLQSIPNRQQNIIENNVTTDSRPSPSDLSHIKFPKINDND